MPKKYNTRLVKRDGSVEQQNEGKSLDHTMKAIRHMLSTNEHGQWIIFRRKPEEEGIGGLPPHLVIEVEA